MNYTDKVNSALQTSGSLPYFSVLLYKNLVVDNNVCSALVRGKGMISRDKEPEKT